LVLTLRGEDKLLQNSNPPHRPHDLPPSDPPLTAVPDGLDALEADIAPWFELDFPLGAMGALVNEAVRVGHRQIEI
jgi:hypothetical protein